MAFNGSGVYSRTNGTNTGDETWALDEAEPVNITSARHDLHDTDMGDALSICVLKDGQQTITADMPWNSKKITGLADAAAHTDACNAGQIQDGTFAFLGTTGGAANVQTATCTPTVTAYANGALYHGVSGYDNTTTGVTLNLDSVGAKALVKPDGAVLDIGELQANDPFQCMYLSSPDEFRLVSQDSAGLNTWTPTYGASGSMTYLSVTTVYGVYFIIGKVCYFQLATSGTIGGTPSTTVTFTLPVTAVDANVSFTGSASPLGTTVAAMIQGTSTTVVNVRDRDAANWSAGARGFRAAGFYPIAGS